ncbi:MAG: hypothetical protein JEZ06_15965 [Anaerolineaceae bacterium]|nr:hypothetical protein [Anaerolineaceae bacterium]
MVKQRPVLAVFNKTDALGEKGKTVDVDALDKGPLLNASVSLKSGEKAAFDQIADDLGVSTQELMNYGLRHFLSQYILGNIKLTVVSE